tara:strand:+ start:4951 stop:5694 length:744 start_codon:yes stop_codon:yes gene_type:complete
MNSVGLIGFGRFGKILADILQKGFFIKAYDINNVSTIRSVKMCELEEVLSEKTIFVSVPIRQFKNVINNIAPRLKAGQIIIDVCSVKKYPVDIMIKSLDKTIGIIATHPLFGPDSIRSNNRLKMMMNNTRDINSNYTLWKEFFKNQGIEILEMSPDEHDCLAASTQGITHFLGRILREYGIKKTTLDTQGFRDLIDLVDQTCNDSWELFTDLQHYNPYTKNMVQVFKEAFISIDERLKIEKDETMEN